MFEEFLQDCYDNAPGDLEISIMCREGREYKGKIKDGSEIREDYVLIHSDKKLILVDYQEIESIAVPDYEE